MATINWKFTWQHNDQPQWVLITGCKQSVAIERVSDMLAGEFNAGDTISSWIEIENQRTMTKAYIKPQQMLKHFEFV
jgi:hypothetical protein